MITFKSNKPEQDIKKSIFAIFEKMKLLSMATVDSSDNSPTSWINTAFFAYTDQMILYILTSPNSIHGKNLQHNDSIAVAVFDSLQQPGNPRQGVQLKGTARRITEKNDEVTALNVWWTRMMNKGSFEEFAKKYESFDSKMHSITLDHVKVFDEPTFGEEVWVTAEITRS